MRKINVLLPIGLLTLLLACSHKLEGPKPEVQGLDPALVCTEQLTTTITLTGANLSPAEVDSLTDHSSLALPAVSLIPSLTLTGEPAPAGAAPVDIPEAHLTWTSQQSMTLRIDPGLALEPGVYNVRVENRNGNWNVLEDGLVAVPPPELDSVEPDLICTAQGPNTLTLSGEGFLRVGDQLPVVTFGDGESFTAASLADCIDLPGPVEDAERCDTLILELPQDALPPGAYSVTVTNPMPAGCSSVEPVTIAVVPPPSLETIDPDLICNEQLDNHLVFSGSGFLDVEGALPVVTIGGLDFPAGGLEGCTDVEGTLLAARTCTTLTLTLPPGSLPVGAHDVTITNPPPADCVSEEQITMAAVPPPEVVAVDPDLICLDEADMTLTVSGSGFLDVEGVLPTVLIDGVSIPADALGDCATVLGTLLNAQSCTTLTVTIPQGSLAAGAYELNVQNPDPAGCVSEQGVSFAVVESPEVITVSPDLVCNAQGDDTITLTGAGFLDVDGALPTVTIAGQSFPASSVGGCQDVAGTATPTRRCTSLTATIPAGSLPDGALEVIVTNPPPAACSSPAGPMLYVAPPPAIDWAQPAPPCTSDPNTLTLTGTGFLTVDGTLPTVFVEGTEVTITAMDGCTPFAGPTAVVETCTGITVSLPAGLLTVGAYSVTVLNPDPPGCEDIFDSAIGLPPTVGSISPVRICETGGQVTVNGSNFLDGARVSIGGVEVPTTFVSDTQLLADVPAGFAGGLYDVTVTNPDGCADTLEDVLQIIELPLVYYVDPPVVYNGINTQVTVFASGIAGDVISVSIRPTGQVGPVTSLNFNFNPARPNRIQAIIPQGTATGGYDVIVEDDVGCIAELIDGLVVTDALTLAIDLVDPPFGWTAEDTAVILLAQDPVTAPDVQFEATPRAYLNPSTAGPGTVATALASVSFVDPVRVNAVVPAGLPVGTYDLIAVNPGGAVGFLPGAFEVTEQAPPLVDNITPQSVINQGGQDVGIEGDHFRNPAVEATCRSPAGAEVVVTATINGFDPQNIDTTFDMSMVAEGSVCVVRVTNDDGTYFDYSALSVTNPARNLSSFTAEAAMLTARRAPAAAAGRPTRTARFIYAFGGDGGTTAGALATAEAAPVDPYGDLGAWFELPYPLPQARTFAQAATIGRFVYLLGGNDGTAAVDTVWRAEVLRPGDAPEITDADIRLGEGTGLAGGVWYYRVAAVFPNTDPLNPDGESLASDPLVIQIPDRPERIHITVVWSGVARASGYRIYRSPDPDLFSGSERLIAEVGAAPLTYTDYGDVAGAEAPLPFGSLGNWAVMPVMLSAREGAGVTAAGDPADPAVVHLYALGGRDAGGTALASYEYLPVTVNADGTHTPGAWTAGANDMPAARWQLAAFLADHAHADVIPAGDVWIYAGAGVASNGTTMRSGVHAAQMQAGGDLGTWSNTGLAMTPPRAGYGHTLANSTLYVFGGLQADASNEGASAQITGPPALANWNNLGLNMTENRYLQGSVTESSFIFQIGGWNGAAATASVDKTVW